MEDLQKALKVASFESGLFLGVFNSKAQSVILMDSEGRIERANAKAHSTFGYSAETMLNQNIQEICHSGIDFSLQQTKGDDGQELLITTNDNKEIWIEYISLEIQDEFEQTQTLLTIEDISTR